MMKVERKDALEDAKRGVKEVARTIERKTASPLTHIKRNAGEEGREKEQEGYATDPKEIDKILRRAWNEVYDGNNGDMKQAAVRFLARYAS